MQVECVHCSKRYSLRDENAGTQFKCRSCGKISSIVAAAPEVARPAATAPLAPAKGGAALVETQCLHCGKQYKLKPQAAGMQFKCKQCGQLSPVVPPPAPPKIAPQVQPRQARTAPRTVNPVGPLIAMPVEPLVAMPVEPLVAIPLDRASAPPAAIPIEAILLGQPGEMLDLFDEASMPAIAQPLGAQGLGVAQPAVRTPAQVGGKKKVQRKSGEGGQAAVVLRILGGAALMCLGVGLAIFGLYALQNDEHGARRPVRVIVLGVCLLGSGFKLMLGWNTAK